MLSAADFASGAQALADAWRRHAPGEPCWQWVPARQPFAAAMGGGYLSARRTVAAGAQAAAVPAADSEEGGERCIEEVEEEEEEEADPADARRQQRTQQEQQVADEDGPPGQPANTAADAVGLELTCHAAFHPSYCVPVLYFEAAGRDGAPLRLESVLAALPQLQRAASSAQPGTVVTQEEHPLLRRPFLMLHPCQTDAVMREMLTGAPSSGVDAPDAANGAGGAEAEAAGWPLRYLLAWLSVAGQPLGLAPPAALVAAARSSE